MKRIHSVIGFIISTIVTVFILAAVALFAANPTFFADGNLFRYDAESEILTIFGESVPLSAELIDSVAEYPARAAEFTVRLAGFPQV